MSEFVEIVLYILVSFVILILAFASVNLGIRQTNLMKRLAKSNSENLLLRDKIAELMDRSDSQKIESTEGFVRFISESREWAFEYIEAVQSSIKDLESVKDVLSQSRPSAENRKKAVEIINNVLKNLPEETPNG